MNVRELLDDLRVPYREHGESSYVSEGWVGLICPWCGTGTSKHGLGINLRYGSTNCWKCGRHSLVQVLAAVTQRTERDIRSLTTGLDRVRAPDRPAGKLVLPDGVGPLDRPHRRYLAKRGFDPDELVKLWGIGGIGIEGRLKWRVFIPIHLDGELVSWTTRVIVDDGPHESRYHGAGRNEEKVSRKSFLYGEDYCRHAVIVVEGHTDVWAGGPGFAATGGLGWSEAQVARIARFPVRVICFDAEETAQRRASALARELGGLPGETHVARLSLKDPATDPHHPDLRELRRRFLE